MRIRSVYQSFFVVANICGVMGCNPKIGDSCKNSSDCSVRGDRICETADPKGYCTIQNCDPDTCPDHARCVRWRPDPARLARTWCMKRCSDNGDCRQKDGYRCFQASDLVDDQGQPLAEMTDKNKQGKFCAVAVSARIGDRCADLTQCPSHEDALCDVTMTGGYCSVLGCVGDDCVENARCVQWFGATSEEMRALCMRACSEDSQCRTAEGYRCVRAADLVDGEGASLAMTIDSNAERKFCALFMSSM